MDPEKKEAMMSKATAKSTETLAADAVRMHLANVNSNQPVIQ